MTTIEEKVIAALAAIGEKTDREKFADQLEIMLKAVRGETGPGKAAQFKSQREEFRKSKEANVARFSKAFSVLKPNMADQALKAKGWQRTSGNQTDYTHKSLPGEKIKVEGDSFTHLKGNEVKQPKTDISMLKPYLDQVHGAKTVNNGSI